MTASLSKTAPVALSEVLKALLFASVGETSDFRAYVCIPTGKVHCISDAIDPENEGLPDDVDESGDYIAVPHEKDLNLGSRLVFAFAEQEMPGDYDRISGFFRKRGAYGRFKEFLYDNGMLEEWYDFDSKATEQRVRAWYR